MATPDKKILIIDEAGFSRVCRAILEDLGCNVTCSADGVWGPPLQEEDCLGLVIISYPYGAWCLDHLRSLGIPIIVLADHLSRELIAVLEDLEKSFCMIKPLDFRQFKSLALELVNQELASQEHCSQGGYRLV